MTKDADDDYRGGVNLSSDRLRVNNTKPEENLYTPAGKATVLSLEVVTSKVMVVETFNGSIKCSLNQPLAVFKWGSLDWYKLPARELTIDHYLVMRDTEIVTKNNFMFIGIPGLGIVLRTMLVGNYVMSDDEINFLNKKQDISLDDVYRRGYYEIIKNRDSYFASKLDNWKDNKMWVSPVVNLKKIRNMEKITRIETDSSDPHFIRNFLVYPNY